MAICGAPDFADSHPGAQVEIEAKLAAGYFAGERPRGDYAGTVGRGLNE